MFKYVLTKYVEELLKEGGVKMFVILEYIAGTYDNLNIVGEDGEPILFGSEHTAELYAKDNCAWNYKIVEL